MLKKFTIKELIIIALFSALAFAIAFFIGTGLVVATGIGLISAIVNAIFVGAIWTLLSITIRKFFTVTLAMTLYSLLAMPTVLFGTPGIYKLVPALVGGLVFDSINYAFKYRKKGYYFGWCSCLLAMWVFLILFYILLGLPGADRILKALPIMIIVSLIMGLFGVWLGIFTFKKVKNKRIIQQLSS